MRLTRCAVVMLCACSWLILPAVAQQNFQNPSTGTGDESQQFQNALAQRDRVILDLERRVEALEQQLRQPRSSTPSPPAVANSVMATSPAPTAPYDEEERLARATLDRTLISKGGLLLPPWTMEWENNISFYNASSDHISINGFSILPVLVVGDIVSERVRRNLVMATATSRLGLPKEFQFEVRVPYGLETEQRVSADGHQTSDRTTGLGDVEIAMYKQIRHQRNGWPDLLTGLRWKTTTGRDPFRPGSSELALGSGFQALQASLTAVRSSDPAVFFGGLSYTANLSGYKRVQDLDAEDPNASTIGHLNPGDTFGLTLGSALAINPEATVSAAWEQQFTRSSSLNGSHLPGSSLTEGLLRLGTSYMYSLGRTIDFSLGIGMTRDTPDFQFSVSLPIRFSLAGKPRAAVITQTPSPKDTNGGALADLSAKR